MQKKLTKLQAYNVMLKFLEKIYEQEKSDYLGNVLSNSEFLFDKQPGDRLSWVDWKQAIVITASLDKKLYNYNRLTLLQAYHAMIIYIRFYADFYNPQPIYFMNLLHNLERNQKILWQDWVRIADIITKQKDPRVYLEFVS